MLKIYLEECCCTGGTRGGLSGMENDSGQSRPFFLVEEMVLPIFSVVGMVLMLFFFFFLVSEM